MRIGTVRFDGPSVAKPSNRTVLLMASISIKEIDWPYDLQKNLFVLDKGCRVFVPLRYRLKNAFKIYKQSPRTPSL